MCYNLFIKYLYCFFARATSFPGLKMVPVKSNTGQEKAAGTEIRDLNS